MSKLKKIVLTGGPSSGKTTIIKNLRKLGFLCFDEVARDLFLGDSVLNSFKKNPIFFTEKVISQRINHYLISENKISNAKRNLCFFDRGIHDSVAYLNNMKIENDYEKKLNRFNYSRIFLLELNKSFFKNDINRIESFDHSISIHSEIELIYKKFNFEIIKVPWMNIEKRTNFILDKCKII
tara:strand:- start:3245 stop:3787 length:543 start_codon:yes stop_codon:yes gene_type:complete